MKTKKWMAVIGLLCVLAALGLLTFFGGGGEPKTFMDEIKATRSKDKATQVPIDDLVRKYIPMGTGKEAARKFCETNGLKIYPSVDKRSFPRIDPEIYDEAMFCSTDLMRWDLLWWFWIGKDTVVVVAGMKDGVVVWAGGEINFASL